jgi:hypothetical protein
MSATHSKTLESIIEEQVNVLNVPRESIGYQCFTWLIENQLPDLTLVSRQLPTLSENDFFDVLILLKSIRAHSVNDLKTAQEIQNIDNKIFKRVDEVLVKKSTHRIYELTESLNYFLANHNAECEEYLLLLLNQFVENYIPFSIDKNEFISFLQQFAQENVIEISTQKGLSGLITTLIDIQKVYQNHHQISEIANRLKWLTEKYCHFIVDQIMPIDSLAQIYSFFPKAININDKSLLISNVLSWESGDLVIAEMFFKATQLLKNDIFENIANRVGEYTLTRKTLSMTELDSPFFRNGTIGLVQRYRQIFTLTGNTKYDIAAKHWLKTTMEQLNNMVVNHDTFNILDGTLGIFLIVKTSIE